MIRRSTWITLAVFITLVVTALVLQRYKKDEVAVEPTLTPKPAMPLIYNLTAQDIIWIEFKTASGNLIEVERNSPSASWVIVGETEETSDSSRIESIVSILVGMRATRIFEAPLGIDTVGLDSPAYTITMRTTSGEDVITRIGELNVVGSDYYIQVNNESAVMVAKLALDEVLKIFTEPPLVATPTPGATETLLVEIESSPTP
mgnify:CR=1 FL=1